MSKTCIGCGIILQNNDKNELGYTPNLEKDYCMRCFKLKHYGENINKKVTFDNKELIKNINDFHCFTLFLTDFINISEEVLNVYKKIKTNKCLVITKKGLLPKNPREALNGDGWAEDKITC